MSSPSASPSASPSVSPSAWIDEASAALKRQDLWRTPRTTSGLGPGVEVDGQPLLLLCSNNYLGLAADPRLAEAAAEAARCHGSGSGASRLVSGTQRLHIELEAALARFKGTEDCVLFSSGYLANLGTIAALVGRGDAVVSDAWNHASIIDGCRLSGAEIAVYPHGDLDACAAALARVAGRRRRLLCTDSVFSMDGDLAPLRELIALGRRHGAMLLVDDAHATGVLGGGRGALAELGGGSADKVDALVGTCSKALGSAGGFVAGSRGLCDYLRNRARSFVFDTAPPPPVVAATLRALSIVEAEPQLGQRVRAHAARLFRGLSALGYDVAPPAAAIVPVIVGDSAQAVALSEGLGRRGVLAPAIRPPTVPDGTARIRLCPMATFDEAQIDQVIAAFAELRGQRT